MCKSEFTSPVSSFRWMNVWLLCLSNAILHSHTQHCGVFEVPLDVVLLFMSNNMMENFCSASLYSHLVLCASFACRKCRLSLGDMCFYLKGKVCFRSTNVIKDWMVQRNYDWHQRPLYSICQKNVLWVGVDADDTTYIIMKSVCCTSLLVKYFFFTKGNMVV